MEKSPYAATETTASRDNDREFTGAVLLVLRDATRGAVAAGTLGILVLGLGGRVAMRLTALLHPEATGAFTENGFRIGAITLDGTLGLVLFGGFFFGLFGAIVWVTVAPWIPGHGLRRALLAGPIAAALASFVLVASGNRDFRMLGDDPLVVAILVVLIAIFGFAVSLFDDWLDRTLPAPARPPWPIVVGSIAVVALGAVLVLPLSVAVYFSAASCGCGRPPVAQGIALLAVGGATLAWWAVRASGTRIQPRRLVLAGRIALATAVALGVLRLAEDAGRIVGRA